MPTFSVTVYDKATSEPTRVRVAAQTAADAARMASKVGWIVDPTGAEAVVVDADDAPTENGKHLASTAAMVSAASFVFVPLAIVGIILGGIAKERSRGAYGSGAQAAGIFAMLAWGVALCLLLAK